MHVFKHLSWIVIGILPSLGSCIEGSVRLLIEDTYSNDDIPVDYMYKDELSRGRVEVCSSGSFRAVCDDRLEHQECD